MGRIVAKYALGQPIGDVTDSRDDFLFNSNRDSRINGTFNNVLLNFRPLRSQEWYGIIAR